MLCVDKIVRTKYAILLSVRDMHHDLCHGKAGLCEEMKPNNGPMLLQYLRKVNFEGKLTKRFLKKEF